MLIEFTLYGILAIACIAASQTVYDWLGRWAGMGLALGGVVMAAASLLGLATYLWRIYTRGRRDWNIGANAGRVAEINAVTAQLRQVASLTPEQLALVGRVDVELVLDPSGAVPKELILLGDNELYPRQAVHRFIADGGPIYLCPAGHYADNTVERRVAQLVTELMVKSQYAEPAAGNRPARWLLREAGLRKIGEGA